MKLLWTFWQKAISILVCSLKYSCANFLLTPTLPSNHVQPTNRIQFLVFYFFGVLTDSRGDAFMTYCCLCSGSHIKFWSSLQMVIDFGAFSCSCCHSLDILNICCYSFPLFQCWIFLERDWFNGFSIPYCNSYMDCKNMYRMDQLTGENAKDAFCTFLSTANISFTCAIYYLYIGLILAIAWEVTLLLPLWKTH